MFTSRKKKEEKRSRRNRTDRPEPPFDTVVAESSDGISWLNAAIWYNQSNPRSRFSFRISKQFERRNGTGWSPYIRPDDIIGLATLAYKLAVYFSVMDDVPRSVRAELKAFAELFRATEDAMIHTESETGKVRHLNGVNQK